MVVVAVAVVAVAAAARLRFGTEVLTSPTHDCPLAACQMNLVVVVVADYVVVDVAAVARLAC